MRPLARCNLFGRAGHDDFAARVAAFGAEVNDVVSRLDDVEVVFDEQDGMACVDEAIERFEQLFNVG